MYRYSILLNSGAWHFWLSTRFSCCLKMKSVENILGYIREQFYRFLRDYKPQENLWDCSRKTLQCSKRRHLAILLQNATNLIASLKKSINERSLNVSFSKKFAADLGWLALQWDCHSYLGAPARPYACVATRI